MIGGDNGEIAVLEGRKNLRHTGVEGFERLVAVKRILPSIAEDEEFITMFVDEAKIAVQLTHANIAQIFDLGRVEGSFFIALEYVHGKDMRAIFNRSRQRGEILPIPLSCYAVMKLCEGLDYAHNKRDASGEFLNLVHRDVSPQNILISYEGEVKLIDFGIAKAANRSQKTPSPTADFTPTGRPVTSATRSTNSISPSTSANAECDDGLAQSRKAGTPRMRAISSVTFAAGSSPPSPGLAPWESLISIARTGASAMSPGAGGSTRRRGA